MVETSKKCRHIAEMTLAIVKGELSIAMVIRPQFGQKHVSYVDTSMKCRIIAGMTLAIAKGIVSVSMGKALSLSRSLFLRRDMYEMSTYRWNVTGYSEMYIVYVSMVISPQFEQKLVSYVETSMKCRHIARMSLAIVKGGLSVSMVINPQFEQKLVSYVETSMKCRHIARMSLAIVKGGLSVSMVINPQFEQKLVSYVETSMKCRHIARMSLAIVKGELFVSYVETSTKCRQIAGSERYVICFYGDKHIVKGKIYLYSGGFSYTY